MQAVSAKGVVYVFFGLIASGKSTLAEKFAEQFGFPCFNTDRVRKELAGVDPVSRQPDAFNKGIYTSDFSRKTYQAILSHAAEEIRSGSKGVVLDGSYSSIAEREKVLELGGALGVQSVFIQCVCSEKVVRERLEIRAKDPEAVSDGRWEIFLVQKEKFEPPEELEPSRLIIVDTEQPVDILLANLVTTFDLQ